MRTMVLKLCTLVTVCLLISCTNTQRENTIRAALVTADIAHNSFVAYDASAQTTIVEKATSLEEGKAKLSEYRASRDKIVTIFISTYHAISAAAIANDDQSLVGVAHALAELAAAVKPFINLGDKP